MKLIFLSLAILLTSISAWATDTSPQRENCPDFLNHEYKRLHSSKTVNLCSLYKEKPLLIVNTASHCGFTKQFGGLESLYKKYKDQGFEVVGFASDDFRQAAKSEEKAAEICYKNFGVTFTMLSPTKVRGKEANPTFAHFKEVAKSPQWNFFKYLVSADGKTVNVYGSQTKPTGSKLEEDLKVWL